MQNWIVLCGELKPFTKSCYAKSRCTKSRYAGTPCSYTLQHSSVAQQRVEEVELLATAVQHSSAAQQRAEQVKLLATAVQHNIAVQQRTSR